jgi:hypothetical protein
MAGKAVQKVETEVPAIIPTGESAALISMIERAARDPAVDIVKMERLFEMAERVKNREAEAAFNAAMAAAQIELVPVARNQKNKQTNSNYADLAAIAAEAMPIIHKHGFGFITSEFESKKPDHLGVAAEVVHSSGHSKRYEFNVPWDGAGMKDNANKTATHAYGSTLSYGERYAKCKVFGIATKDDDGNAAGAKVSEFVSDEQIDAISKKIIEVGANVEAFLKMGEVESISDIAANRFDQVMALLDMKKKATKS